MRRVRTTHMSIKNRNLNEATRNAINGLVVLARENAARREVVLLIISGVMLYFDKNIYFLLIFILSWVLLAIEAMNTSIELLCNLYTEAFDQRIKDIKDVAASAIFLILVAQAVLLLAWLASLL